VPDKEKLKGFGGAIPITADELKFAQTAQTLTLPGQWETAGAVSGSLAQIVRFGLDDRYFDTYAGKVLALGLADAGDAARAVHPRHRGVGDRGRPRQDRAPGSES
jgi:zinc protease